jgi:hypothetical protein
MAARTNQGQRPGERRVEKTKRNTGAQSWTGIFLPPSSVSSPPALSQGAGINATKWNHALFFFKMLPVAASS